MATPEANPLPYAGLRCPKCDYDLTGLPAPRCPECGVTFDAASLPRWQPSPMRRLLAWPGLLLALPAPAWAVALSCGDMPLPEYLMWWRLGRAWSCMLMWGARFWINDLYPCFWVEVGLILLAALGCWMARYSPGHRRLTRLCFLTATTWWVMWAAAIYGFPLIVRHP